MTAAPTTAPAPSWRCHGFLSRLIAAKPAPAVPTATSPGCALHFWLATTAAVPATIPPTTGTNVPPLPSKTPPEALRFVSRVVWISMISFRSGFSRGMPGVEGGAPRTARALFLRGILSSTPNRAS